MILKKLLIPTLAILGLVGCNQPPAAAPVVYKTTPEKIEIAKTVGVTGAAGELRRLTSGGYEELVSQLSNDKQWLLIDTYTMKNKKKSKSVIQKLNVQTGAKIILTPSNSTNDRAVWNKNDSNIIFRTLRSGSSIVKSMGVNGENGIQFITNSSLGTAGEPNINKSGTDIVFVLNRQISMIKPDGTQVRMFGPGFSPKFSPDEDKILFSRIVGDFVHLFSMKTNGTQLTQLTSETARDYEGTWSPEGDKIAFISNRSNNHKHLFMMNATGSNIIQLTDGNFDVSSVYWGEDGYIYFSANAGGNRDIWVLKPMKL